MSFDPPGRSEGYGACDDEQSAPRKVFFVRHMSSRKMIPIFFAPAGANSARLVYETIAPGYSARGGFVLGSSRSFGE